MRHPEFRHPEFVLSLLQYASCPPLRPDDCIPISLLRAELPETNTALLAADGQDAEGAALRLRAKRHGRDPAQRCLRRRPVPIHRAAGQVDQTQRVTLPPTRHAQKLSVGADGQAARRRRELHQTLGGRRVARDADFMAGLVAARRRRCSGRRRPWLSVVDVDHAARRANHDPAVTSEARAAAATAQRDDRRAHSALVVPQDNVGPALHAPLANLAVTTGDRQAGAVAPPAQIGNAVLALDAGRCDPLHRAGREDVDRATRTAAETAHERHVAAAGRELEAFHRALLVLVTVDGRRLLDRAAREIPAVEEAASAGKEDFVARWMKCRRVYRHAAHVDGGEERMRRGKGVGRVMMQVQSGCKTGRQNYGDFGVERQRADRRLLAETNVAGSLDVNDLGAKFCLLLCCVALCQ
jgi:hypothetical protein